jgi:hypothetical protein
MRDSARTIPVAWVVLCGLRGIGAAEVAAVIGHERRETTR